MALPFHSKTLPPPLSSHFEVVEEGDRSILIVDDEEAVRNLFATCLGDRYSCVTAGDAQEALVRLAGRTFALVITDVNMPGLSGIELLRRVTQQFPDTAVIVVSVVNRTQRVLDAVRLGAFDYLVKPCDLDVLVLSVERALERRALLRDARRYKQDLERQNAELARRKSELERLQSQIVHSEKMASLGRLAAGIAHELNNPAGFIHGNIEYLHETLSELSRVWALYDGATLPSELAARVAAAKEETGYEAALGEMTSIIADCRDGASRIRDVVQNLRVFSRLDEAEFKRVDIHEGIESTVRLLSSYYSSGHVALRRDYGGLPPVNCYAGQLNQVWMNLLVNAAQSIDGDGEVRISTSFDGRSAVVAVSDTGRGIEAEHLNKIFDPFFTTKPVGEGTGLGLSIAYSIVERHGGSITVESRKGSGTTFTITIPAGGKSLKDGGGSAAQPEPARSSEGISNAS